MKKQLLLLALFCLSAIAFGQKKEIKKAERALASGNASEAISFINQAEPLLAGADSEMKSKFYVIKGNAYLAEAGTADYAKLKTASESFKMAEELSPTGKTVQDLSVGKQNLRVALVNSAIQDQKTKNYKRASEKLYMSYKAMKDTSDLYYAAGNAVNAREYPTALTYYKDLFDMGYTGIKKEWVAIDVETSEEVVFATEADRNTNMLTGKYTKPTERMSESVQADILEKITKLYIELGENEKALSLMKDARAANPDDIGLVQAEAGLALQMGDMKKYASLMEEVVKSDPNNPELYYNLGVSSSDIGQKDKAKEYYQKALSLDPKYTNAKINLAQLILSGETEIVEEMNSLGSTNADYDRYDELKLQQEQLYRDALPFLEDAAIDRPKNEGLVRTLANIYGRLGMEAKEKATKAKLEALENGGE
ncbi:tetratricopeptide repeat protein [Aureitalea sp. L0-47]|uniref:tetratricopeptide repeat protein n=1 Tax=Aureitalea sp. L0-47 TaxID=2816962 RepID=UPI0022388459|nr:tetratricopeptide repeat protein [Aureitalea sp. L0-47]MCW5520814.1 tetratricopeptide repeat protein [Aureitalea sp. L0-47]